MMPGQRTRPEVRRWLSDERRQYDSERRRLVRQQQSDSLHSLTARERDRQSTAQHHQDHALTLFLSRHPPGRVWEPNYQLPTCALLCMRCIY